MPAPHRILLLAFPNGQLLDIAGPVQMFAGANDELSRQVYRIEIAAPQAGPFATSSGVRLVADVSFAQITNNRLARIHTLITVGGEPGMRQELVRGNLTDIVYRAIGRVPRIASVCSGTFFLAAAGALDGRRAATHWSEVEALKRFRPAVLVDGDAIHIEDRGIWTSAGVTAGMDLALAMIEADLFPELTQLDLTGPQQVLARLPQSAMHIVAKSDAPVSSDSGLSLVPTHTFENCPRLDLICIPGGSTGVVRAMGDRDTTEFVRKQSVMAKYVTSVCTGAFILGAAGLLKGRRATTHWAFTELLPLAGATHEKGRV